MGLPVKPLKRSKAGHTGTSRVTITAPNLSFPDFKQEIKDSEQMMQGGAREMKLYREKKQR